MFLLAGTSLAAGNPPETTNTQRLASSPAPIVAPAAPPALVVLYNQPVAILRSPLYGYSPEQRVRSLESRLIRLIDEGKLGPITTQRTSEGMAILIGGSQGFTIAEGDADQLAGETLEEATQLAVSRLESIFRLIKEETSWSYLLTATAWAVGLTALFLLVIWIEVRTWRWLRPRVERLQHQWKRRADEKGLFMLNQLSSLLVSTGRVAFWIAAILVTYEWLALVLRQFPYTRPWSEHMTGYFLAVLKPIATGMIRWLPDVVVIAFILAIAKFLVWLVRMLAIGIRSGRISASWIDVGSVRPTSRILIVVVWLFAVVMIYPYLPGSQSAGFRSVAVFVGLLVSLGATGVVGQLLGGFVLMYTRTLKTGDYVRIGDQEGLVESIGFMSTRLRTIKNETINIPNAVIMGVVTTNYSRLADSEGVFVSASVTIGYDTPWRQVHAMMIRAAERTQGLRKTPSPVVWQRSLSDFYAEYELNIALETPEQRIAVMSALHANIQDEFNEHGVQIMSPHFMANPPEKVWVPKENWCQPPATALVEIPHTVENGRKQRTGKERPS